ncbi:MAG: chlorite dismutase family protein [Armatimonadetes bacterium]|nr:chlorite dismutase family protein [Armatimonadota bacterium]MDW8121824.1 chlorite dismutase family protein [Armatimonadota bacterium]
METKVTTKPWASYWERLANLERPRLPKNIHKSTDRLVFCYQFYKVERDWWLLDEKERERAKEDLQELITAFDAHLIIRPYSTLGLKSGTDFLLWIISRDLVGVEAFAAALQHSFVGPYITRPYTYLTLTRPSVYLRHSAAAYEEDNGELEEDKEGPVFTGEAPYLFIYPFTKTHQWYQLPYQERKEMMWEHFRIGHQFSGVRTYTSYSMGLDDYEFVVAFEGSDPYEFQSLVMKLREAKARPFTQVDIPIFTCIRRDIRELIETVL